MFDLDWLGQLYPVPDEDDPHNMELQIRSFAAVLPHFIEGGARYLVVGSTIERRDQLDRFISAIDATDVTVVLAKASPATVHDRVRERESSPRLLEDFLARTDALAATIEEAALHDLAVWNDGRDITEVAHEVLDHLGW